MSINEVIVKGGLGNQLFCIFYAYKILLEKNKVSLNLVNYSLTRRKDRPFLLASLLPSLNNIFDLRESKKSYFIFLYAKLFEMFFFKSNSDRLPGDNTFSIKYWHNCYIHSGYFQKITDSELDIKSLKLMREQISPYLNGFKSESLAVHIRRGDYLNKKDKIHGIISEDYLVEEIKKQISLDSFDGITIFSDSPELIDLNIFKSLHKNVFIDKGGDTIEVFKRMSNHKGLIASNSTFSLWAGILGNIKYFSIPSFWMKNIKSSIIGLDNIPRYNCKIK